MSRTRCSGFSPGFALRFSTSSQHCRLHIGPITETGHRHHYRARQLEHVNGCLRVQTVLVTARGKVSASLNGTYTTDQRQQITPTAPVFDLADTVGNSPSLRLVGNLSWSLRGWTVQGTVNYTGAYRDPGSVPVRKVDSWTTVDLNIGYRVDGGSGWLANTQSNLGINNALDRRPPFVNQFDLISGTLGYDPANANVLGRQVSLQFVKRWGQ